MSSIAAVPTSAPRYRGIVTFCVMAATLMQALDTTIANVALPYMQGSLAATSDEIVWVLTSYIVAAAIMTAPVGWLSARFGRKRFFLVCLAGFTVASMLCGMAGSLAEMVLFRLLQGVFGAALVPLSQSIMLDIYPVGRRGSAMALWGMGIMIGPIVGPTLGGYLTETYDWRWVFYVNLPFGLLAFTGLWLFLDNNGLRQRSSFDWTGFLVLSIGLAGLQLMLDRGELLDWFGSTEIIVETVLAVLGIYLFIVHTFLAEKPFLSPRIFLDLNFLAGFLLMLAVGMILLASATLLSPYLQSLGNYPIATAGLLMAPRGAGTMAAMMLAGRLSDRVDRRLVMLVGLLMIAATMWDMSTWTPDISVQWLVVTTILQGFGLGLVFIPLQVVAFTTLAAELRTDAAALLSLIRNVGSAIGISVTSFMLTQNTQILHAQIAQYVTPFNRMLQTGAAYLLWNPTSASGLAALNAEVTQQATINAYADDFRLMLYVSLLASPLLLLMRRGA